MYIITTTKFRRRLESTEFCQPEFHGIPYLNSDKKIKKGITSIFAGIPQNFLEKVLVLLKLYNINQVRSYDKKKKLATDVNFLELFKID